MIYPIFIFENIPFKASTLEKLAEKEKRAEEVRAKKASRQEEEPAADKEAEKADKPEKTEETAE